MPSSLSCRRVTLREHRWQSDMTDRADAVRPAAYAVYAHNIARVPLASSGEPSKVLGQRSRRLHKRTVRDFDIDVRAVNSVLRFS